MAIPLIPVIIVSQIVQSMARTAQRVRDADTQRKNVDMTIAENKKLAELGYKRDQEQLKYQNEYNSPANQMKRFTDAGLNKNLIYTQGNPGNQSSIARYQPPSVKYDYISNTNLGDSLQPIFDLPLKALEIQRLVTQNKIGLAQEKMQTALSKYADELAEANLHNTLNNRDILDFKRVFDETEFNYMFIRKPGDNTKWILRPGTEEAFVERIIAKLFQPSSNLEQTQQSVEALRYQNEVTKATMGALKAVPWLNQLFKFVSIIRP